MDWERAKTILIVAFIFLNLFLSYQIYQIFGTTQPINELNATTKQPVNNNFLAKNGLTLEGTWPKDVNTLKVYQGTIQHMTGWQKLDHGYQRRFAQGEIIVHNEAQLHDLLSKLVPSFADFRLSSQPKNMQGLWVYTEQIDKRPVFDGIIKVQIEKEQVRSVSISAFKLKSTKMVRIIDFNTALTSLINYKTSNKQTKMKVISNVQLGYETKPFDGENYFFIPVWRFQFKNYKTLDVPAANFGSAKKVEEVH